MASNVLEMRSVTKRFGRVIAVSDLSLDVRGGEIYGLIGPNGSGKTTTIRMIVGLYRPTKGSVSVGGFDLEHRPTEAKRLTGYIPDDPAAYDRLTGKEFLEFVGQLYGMDRRKRDERIGQLLSEFGLRKTAETDFGSYSRGTKQKICIAAALLHEPSLLLIDEPMVGLDPASAKTAKRLFKEFAGRGGAIFLSTHTLSTAEEICGRIGILNEGKIVEEGTVSELGRKAGLDKGSLEDYYLKIVGQV